MRNIFNFLLALSCSALFLYSCESEIESEVQSTAEELIVSAKENTLAIDSVELGSIEMLNMTDELKALKERMDELKKTNTRAASSSYDQYFSTNMWAIRELPFTLQVRSSGSYLATQGRGKEVTIGRRLPQDFYVKIPSSITGIPYLIYSDNTKTPLTVGYYTNNPNQKILLVMDNDNPNEIFASWDIISATNNPGYYVIQNESYTGQGSSGSWWDVFNYVVNVSGDYYVGYSQYSQNATQEFAIAPRATFNLKKLEFINSYSAIVTQKENISVQQATINSSPQLKRENMEFNKVIEENSYFEEEKGIAFKVPVSDLLFARPTVTLGEIDLIPNNQIPADTKYEPGVRAVFERNLHQIVPVTVKPRTKLVMTYYYKVYDVSIDYVATIVYNDREAKLPGRWSGKIYVDEIFEPDFEEINLDTQRSMKGKVNIKNATLSSPVTF